MDATHETHDSVGFWTFGNIVLGLGFSTFIGVAGLALLYQAFFAKPLEKAPAASAESAAAAPAAPAPAAPASTPNSVATTATAAPAVNSATKPASAPATDGSVQEVVLKTSPTNPLAYNTSTLTVKSGQKVHFTFTNDSIIPQPHNFILCKVGTREKVLAQANSMLTADPNAFAKGYIPESADIIVHTKLLNPKDSESLDFVAPAPGDYPYFCSFPGHFVTMSGVLKVQ